MRGSIYENHQDPEVVTLTRHCMQKLISKPDGPELVTLLTAIQSVTKNISASVSYSILDICSVVVLESINLGPFQVDQLGQFRSMVIVSTWHSKRRMERRDIAKAWVILLFTKVQYFQFINWKCVFLKILWDSRWLQVRYGKKHSNSTYIQLFS